MSRFVCVLSLLLLATATAPARHSHHYVADETVLNVGGLQFQIPDGWQAQMPETSARAGQWMIPSASGPVGDGVEVVVFFFGPGLGGSAQENIDGWSAAITTPDGHPVAATPAKRAAAGHAITEVLLSGTYVKNNPQAGLPPTLKPGYALLGAVIENGGGTVFWRVTGPAAAVTALAPMLDRIIDSLKPQPASPPVLSP